MRWCHLTVSKPLVLSLETIPNLSDLFSMVLEHPLHEERFDLAYSAFIDSGVAIGRRGFRPPEAVRNGGGGAGTVKSLGKMLGR